MSANIKWIKNSRVKKNSKIPHQDILEKESDAQAGEVVVSMTNITKKYPILNIKFPSLPEVKENKILTSGKWVTKSWTTHSQTIASINTEEDCVHFNRTKFKSSELNNFIEIINKVKEIV